MQSLYRNRFLFAVLLVCQPIVAAAQESISLRSARGAIFDEWQAIESAIDVHQRASKLPVQQRYDYLADWVLPSADHSAFRLELDFASDDPVLPQNGGQLVSPALDLIAAASELDRLAQLHERVESARAADGIQQRRRTALLALVEMAQQDYDAVMDKMQLLSNQGNPDYQDYAETSVPRRAETLLCWQGQHHPQLRDAIRELVSSIAERDIRPNLHRSDRDAWNRHIAALFGKFSPDSSPQLRDNAGREETGVQRFSDWGPVSRISARTRGRGMPPAHWRHLQNSVQKDSVHDEDYLYYNVPLRGNFEVECDITGHSWQDIYLLVAGFWVAPANDSKSYQIANATQWLRHTPISPLLSPFDEWVRYRVVVRDGVATSWCNGRLIHRQPLEPEHDPWLAVRSPWYATGSVRSLRITGSPEVPRRIAMAALPNLAGWKSYYDRPVGSGAPWSPATGLRGVFGRLQQELGGTGQESLLYYHRPLLGGGTIEYEFYYREGEVLVHPALDRLVFLLNPNGVQVHRATDGVFDRTATDPLNVSDEPDSRRGPPQLPLKNEAWNRLHLTLTGDTLHLLLNDHLIYERELEPDNQRLFGFFHYADQTEARVRNVTWRGNWPRALPAIEAQELAGAEADAIQRELATLKATVHHMFSGDELSPDRFAVLGEDNENHVTAKTDGLHVNHPGKDGYSSTSVALQMRAHGNFEITASFDELSFTPSDEGSAGISLTAILENSGYTHGTLHRGAMMESGKQKRQFVQAEFVRTPEDQPRMSWHGTVSEEATSGRLRLARVGETLWFLIAENDSPNFRLIHTEQVGTESLLFGGIRLSAGVFSSGKTHGKTHGTTSVIWKDITVRAERITDWTAPGNETP